MQAVKMSITSSSNNNRKIVPKSHSVAPTALATSFSTPLSVTVFNVSVALIFDKTSLIMSFNLFFPHTILTAVICAFAAVAEAVT